MAMMFLINGTSGTTSPAITTIKKSISPAPFETSCRNSSCPRSRVSSQVKSLKKSFSG